MARTAVFTSGVLLDAAERLVAAGGPRVLTVESLSSASGAAVGSIYHRFPSRAVLAAELCNRRIARRAGHLPARAPGRTGSALNFKPQPCTGGQQPGVAGVGQGGSHR